MAQYPLNMTDEEWKEAGRPTLLKSQWCDMFNRLLADFDLIIEYELRNEIKT